MLGAKFPVCSPGFPSKRYGTLARPLDGLRPSARSCRVPGKDIRNRPTSTSIVPRAAVEKSEAATLNPGPKRELKWWEKDAQANMKDIGSIQQLVDELADAGDKLVIVEFYAHWCNACKALYPKICRMMGEHLDDVVFLKVEYDANKAMCKTMGIQVLPNFMFFRGAEGKVDQFTCTVSKIQRLKDAIEMYTAPFCSLWKAPGLSEYPDVQAHAKGPLDSDWGDDLPAGADLITVLGSERAVEAQKQAAAEVAAEGIGAAKD